MVVLSVGRIAESIRCPHDAGRVGRVTPKKNIAGVSHPGGAGRQVGTTTA
jgi:hypothetical protein